VLNQVPSRPPLPQASDLDKGVVSMTRTASLVLAHPGAHFVRVSVYACWLSSAHDAENEEGGETEAGEEDEAASWDVYAGGRLYRAEQLLSSVRRDFLVVPAADSQAPEAEEGKDSDKKGGERGEGEEREGRGEKGGGRGEGQEDADGGEKEGGRGEGEEGAGDGEDGDTHGQCVRNGMGGASDECEWDKNPGAWLHWCVPPIQTPVPQF